MSAALPNLLDPMRAVETKAAFAGSVPLERFSRLREILVDRKGKVDYELAFRRDDDGCAVAVGHVRALLGLECQRCLEPMWHQVDADIALALVKGPAEVRELPDDYEPLMLEERLIRTRDLLEDELLLGIPQIPRHLGDLCAAHGAANRDYAVEPSEVPLEKNNPFAVLADRIRNDKP